MTRFLVLFLILIGISSVSYAQALTSINIDGKFYDLVIYSVDEHAEVMEIFNENIKRWKRPEKITSCSFVINLPVTARGNPNYGGYCISRVGEKTEYLMICADIMIGHLKTQSYDQSHPTEINDLAKFVINNCYGG